MPQQILQHALKNGWTVALHETQPRKATYRYVKYLLLHRSGVWVQASGQSETEALENLADALKARQPLVELAEGLMAAAREK